MGEAEMLSNIFHHNTSLGCLDLHVCRPQQLPYFVLLHGLVIIFRTFLYLISLQSHILLPRTNWHSYISSECVCYSECGCELYKAETRLRKAKREMSCIGRMSGSRPRQRRVAKVYRQVLWIMGCRSLIIKLKSGAWDFAGLVFFTRRRPRISLQLATYDPCSWKTRTDIDVWQRVDLQASVSEAEYTFIIWIKPVVSWTQCLI